MADSDDNWAVFQQSLREPDEEVETDEDSTEDETDSDEDSDDDKGSKKSKKAVDDDTDTDDEDDSTDDSEDDDSDKGDDEDEDDKKGSDYKPRLKQFLNKNGSLNAERIEKSYIENSKETVRLDTAYKDLDGRFNQLLDAIKAKPDVAEALFGKEGAKNLAKGKPAQDQQPTDPLLIDLKARRDNASKREYNKFVEKHPEVVTDPVKARQIGSFLGIYGAQYRKDNDGELPTMTQGLEAAFKYYGWDTKGSKKEKIASAAKKVAATRTTGNAHKPAPKRKENKQEDFFAKKMGVKLKT